MMKVSEFVSQYRQKHPDGHFFDRETLKYWGERFSDMKYQGIKVITDYSGRKRRVHELKTIQRVPELGKRWTLNYFEEYTYEQVFPDSSIEDKGEWVSLHLA